MYRVDTSPTVELPAAVLEHGTFNDGICEFAVRSASTDPGIVRVHAIGVPQQDYWVLVLTDVGTSFVGATWIGQWEMRSAVWKACFVAWTFHLYFGPLPAQATAGRRLSDALRTASGGEDRS